jgi:hypothetical protein
LKSPRLTTGEPKITDSETLFISAIWVTHKAVSETVVFNWTLSRLDDHWGFGAFIGCEIFKSYLFLVDLPSFLIFSKQRMSRCWLKWLTGNSKVVPVID